MIDALYDVKGKASLDGYSVSSAATLDSSEPLVIGEWSGDNAGESIQLVLKTAVIPIKIADDKIDEIITAIKKAEAETSSQ